MDQVSAGELIFAAPAWGAGGFANAGYAGVGMDFDEEKGGDGMGTAASAASGAVSTALAPEDTFGPC